MIELVEYEDKYYNKWNEFVENSNNGTIFHRLDFLSYHNNKFAKNGNHLLWLKGGKIIALLPFGIFKRNGEFIGKSPFGASFGGFIHNENVKITEAIEIVESFLKYILNISINKCEIIFPPYTYYSEYNNHFEFALYSLGFKLEDRIFTSILRTPPLNSDIWHVFSSNSRNSVRKASKNFDYYHDVTPDLFYPILIEDKKRHDFAVPTHTLEDLIKLKELFPSRVVFDIAVNKENEKAGICYFHVNNKCIITFYLSQEDKALGSNGLRYLIYEGIKNALKLQYQYIDFGTSLDKELVLQKNTGVAIFKERCGAKGYFRDTYVWIK